MWVGEHLLEAAVRAFAGGFSANRVVAGLIKLEYVLFEDVVTTYAYHSI